MPTHNTKEGGSGRYKMPSKNRALQKKKARERNRKWVSPLKTNTGCQKCGFKHDNPIVFDFHHVDPTDKYRTKTGNVVHLSDMMHYSFDAVMKEVIKCIVVCKCCHALIEDETIKGGKLNGTSNETQAHCEKTRQGMAN